MTDLLPHPSPSNAFAWPGWAWRDLRHRIRLVLANRTHPLSLDTPARRGGFRVSAESRLAIGGAVSCRSITSKESRGREAALCDCSRRPRADGSGRSVGKPAFAGEWVRSFAIITTTPNALCAELHDRIPVVLRSDVWPEWLGEKPADSARLKILLAPYPAEEMTCWPVSTRVGNVKNNDPSLIEPVALAA
jgi:hypothetical protein